MGVSVACNRHPEYADEIEGIVHEIYNGRYREYIHKSRSV